MTSISNQLFLIGSQGDISNSYATLWITSLNGTLKKQIQLTSSPSDAYSIISHNNKLFIAGDQNYGEERRATLWILNMDGSIQATIPLNLSEGYLSSLCYGLTIVNNKLYLTGRQQDASYAVTALLWILDTEGLPEKTLLIGESGVNSQGNFIEAKDNKLYITGSQEVGEEDRPFLWINSLDGQILGTINLNTADARGLSLTFYNNHLYVSGSMQLFPSVIGYLWIRQMDGTYVNTVELSEDPISSNALSVKSLENQILVAGNLRKNNQFLATLWLLSPDGSLTKTIQLGQEGGGLRSAYFIYLPEKNTQTLENALRTFSPIKYQKGA